MPIVLNTTSFFSHAIQCYSPPAAFIATTNQQARTLLAHSPTTPLTLLFHLLTFFVFILFSDEMVDIVVDALRRWVTPRESQSESGECALKIESEEFESEDAAAGLQCLHLVSYIVQRPSLQGGLADAGLVDLIAAALKLHGGR